MNQSNWQQYPTDYRPTELCHLADNLDFPVFFSSGSSQYQTNDDRRYRYSIFSAAPTKTINLQNEIERTAFESTLQAMQEDLAQPPAEGLVPLPFYSGVMGFLSYEFGEAGIIKKTLPTKSEDELPYAFAGYYPWSYVYDLKNDCAYITFSPRCPAALCDKIKALFAVSPVDYAAKNSNFSLTSWKKSQTRADYTHQFKVLKNYIKAGDCYQTNLTQRFAAGFSGNSFRYFLVQCEQINNPYSAYFSFSAKAQILSFSPEQFLEVNNKHIQTRPIKGTWPLTDHSGEMLKKSVKNQAENVMIVDLMRNDLSKVCQPYSVKVSKLFEIETFTNVHHMVSTVEGTLDNSISSIDALLSCFPGGSITGAPKKRAMEIINELEIYPRNAYCGSIFYSADHGRFDSNIMIRTVVREGDNLYCWGGGGIVADSVEDDEYQESLTKVNNITLLDQ